MVKKIMISILSKRTLVPFPSAKTVETFKRPAHPYQDGANGRGKSE